MWSQIRKLKEQCQSITIQMLTEENHTYTIHQEISELMASTYTKLSDNSDYDTHFIPLKLAQARATSQPHPKLPPKPIIPSQCIEYPFIPSPGSKWNTTGFAP